jgi:hypothetical protein
MRKHNRRQFIAQLVAASIGSTGLSRAVTSAIDHSNDGLAELCVVARQPGTMPNDVVDVWSGQIGTLDLSQLPEHFGRVVVWDDIRGERALWREIAGILVAIEEYFGIQPNLACNATAHFKHISGLSPCIDKLLHTFEPSDCDAIGSRVAVIDLSSCGLTSLRWLDIIPSLRRYYTHLIGVDLSLPELCEIDATCDPPHGLSGLARETLQACDYWFLAGGESITAGRVELSTEERSLNFTKFIHDLCDRIASIQNEDVDTTIGSMAKHQFATFGAQT